MTKSDIDQDELNRRYAYAVKIFDSFATKYGGNLLLDKLLLQHMLYSWGIDEKRHIEFHKIKTPRHYKQAAYFVYWFVKLKPVQVKLKSINDRACVANERFALSVALNILNIPANSINKELFEKLEYMLHYRNFSAESLFIIFELLQKHSIDRI